MLESFNNETYQALIKREEMYRRIVESSAEAIIIHSDEKIVYTNQAGVKLLGASSKEEVIGKPVFDIVPEKYLKRSRERFQYILKEDKPVKLIEQKILRYDGTLVDVEVSSTLVVYEGKAAVQAVFRNITERQIMENRLKEALRKADTLSIAGNLAAGVAHEVRNPLTVIQVFIQLFKQQDNGNKEFLNLILEEVKRIELIIGEFLMLSKPQSLIFKENPIQTIIQHTVALFETQAIMKNIEIMTVYDNHLPLIKCEENQLKQVFINLLKNAMEAMPGGS